MQFDYSNPSYYVFLIVQLAKVCMHLGSMAKPTVFHKNPSGTVVVYG